MYEPAWKFPTTALEAAEILREAAGRATPIAGGTDLTARLRSGDERPEVLVDLAGIEEFGGVDLTPDPDAVGQMTMGALNTHGALARDDLVRQHVPLLAEACATVGSPQIRSRGTVGGNVANASPAADAAVALLALDAAVRVVSADDCEGDRAGLPLEGFFTGPGETVLRDDELIADISFDCPAESARSLYLKAGQRKALAIAIVSVAALYEPEAGLVRIALGSVAPTAVRARDAENLFESEWPAGDCEAVIDAVAARAVGSASCIDDVRASGRYRRILIETLTRSALRRLCLDLEEDG
jgi:CO/xanthine dehydrogenase FAD-binding subunit